MLGYVLCFLLGVRIDEVFGTHVATASFDLNLFVPTNAYIHSLATELVYAFRFTNKQNVELVTLGILVDKFGQSFVDHVMAFGDVASLVSHQIGIDLFQLLHLSL